MPDYRRYRIPGGTYFFTVNLLERRPNDLLVRHIDVLRQALLDTRKRWPFHIDAWVVLPDHLHCVWTLPKDDDDNANRWRCIKHTFSKAIPKTERRSKVRLSRGERGIWQRRFWEHMILDDADYAAHIDYCHINPLKHGLVEQVADLPKGHKGHTQPFTVMSFEEYPSDWATPTSFSTGCGDGERL